MKYELSATEARELDDLIRRVARFVVRDFPGAEYEDVVQDVWLEVCKMNRPLKQDSSGATVILGRLAKAAAWKQRTKMLQNTIQYTYRPSDVRSMLETLFYYEEWTRSYVPDDAKSLVADGMDPVDLRSDMARAFLRLPKNYQNALIGRYRDKVVPAGNSRERKSLDRAVQYLTDLLNSEYWTPGRHTVNNNAAMEMLRNQEEK